MIDFELILLILVFITGTYLIFRNFEKSLYVLLVVSVLLHKELFSIFKWDYLPIRFLMVGILIYGIAAFFRWLYFSLKAKKFKSEISRYFSDPFVVSLLGLWVVRGFSIFFSKDILDSLQLYAFFTTVVVLGLTMLSRFRSDSEKPLSYIKFYIIVAFGLCLFSFLQIYLYYKFGLVIGALWSIPNNLPRIGSLFWDVNHFGAFLASLMPVLGVLILVVKSWRSKIFLQILYLL
jgi:hypothetical protein